MVSRARAFTFVELILVVFFIGIFAAICLPRLNFAIISKQKADCLAKKIVTDLRRTRSLAICEAANNSNGFALTMTGSAPYSGFAIVNLDTAATVDSYTIDPSVSCSGGADFEFGPLGNLLSGSDNQLTVAGNGKSFTITIISATGLIKCTEN